MTEKDHKALFDSIHKLYVKVYEKIFAAKDSGVLYKIPYERIKSRNLDFSMNTTSFDYDFENIEYFDYYDWSTDAFVSFMDIEVKKLPEFEVASEEIRRVFEMPEETKKYIKSIGLSGFVGLLMRKVPNQTITDENITFYIDTYIEDCKTQLNEKLYTWYIAAWLANFHIASEAISIGNLVLRKPRIEELGVIRPKTYYIDEFDKMMSQSLFSTCILEFSQRAPTQNIGLYSDEIKHEIENCLDVLRLFKIANVIITHLSVSPVSVLERGHTESPESPFDKSWKGKIEPQYTSNYYYEIAKDEETGLILFFEKIKPILKNISQKNYFSGNYLDLAFHRYKDSLLRSEVNVNRMISAITCLEALLSDSQSEISYKISIHVAGLLKHFGFDSMKVYEKMRKAYSIRSNMLHGSKLSDTLIEFSKQHTHEIVNYARICLLVSLQLKDIFEKSELIKKIDYALIDEKQFSELGAAIKENVLIPVVYPYRLITGGDDFEKKKIVCIGWGSLIWDTRELKINGEWHNDGPALPVEFVRESLNKRITLVIDKESKPMQTFWAIMDTTDVSEAIESLKEREGSDKIDFINATDKTDDPLKKKITDWLKMKGINVAIWTGLGSQFNGKKRRPTVEEVIAHLKGLTGEEKERAEEYILKTPKQINTQYRKKIEDDLGWNISN